MGCSIHAKIQYRFENEIWFDICDDIDIHRNYNLFAYLADVRNGTKGSKFYIYPISSPRGLPEFEQFWGLSKKYGSDGHSHSYCTFDEFIRNISNTLKEEVFGKLWFKIWELSANFYGHSNCRMVFFFDN